MTGKTDGTVFALGIDAFSFKIPVFRFNAQGGLDTNFSQNGFSLIDGLSSATVRFDPVRILPLSSAATHFRFVGELTPSGGASNALAVVDAAPAAIVKTFNPGGIPISTDARLIGDRTVISGTLQSFTSPIDKCLYVLDANSNQTVFNTYRFNPLSSTSSKCRALTDIPGSNQFFVGGNQQGLVITPVVAKFKLDGELDKSFAGDGVAKLEGLGSVNLVTSLLVQPNGKILVGLGEGTVVRLLLNGKYDNSFSNDGIVKLKPGAGLAGNTTKLVLGAAGSIFLKMGNSIAKLNSSGVLQTDFGSNGFVDLPGMNDINVSGGTVPTVQVLRGSEFRRIFQ